MRFDDCSWLSEKMKNLDGKKSQTFESFEFQVNRRKKALDEVTGGTTSHVHSYTSNYHIQVE